MNFARYCLYFWGASLPFISFSREKAADVSSLSDRLAAPELFGLLLVLLSLPAGRLLRPNSFYPSVSMGFLLFMAGVSTMLAALYIPPGQSLVTYTSQFLIFGFLVALSMRACVLLRGEREILIFASCIALGGFIESLIVGHDLAARLVGASMWFRDSMDLRARGTFRASGMLAQYGFVVGGVLFALASWPKGIGLRTRLWWTLTSVSLLMYPIFTTRRSGIAALFVLMTVWIVLNQMHGLQGLKKSVPVLVPVSLILFGYLSQPEYRDFLFGRVTSAHQKVSSGHSFQSDQIDDARQSASKRPFFGVGWGLSTGASRTENEMHSTYLAVIVDAGLAGFIAFLALLWSLFRASWRLLKMTKQTPYL
ncbi:MAG: hypothetical protein AAB036_08880 [Elusimicrobiota bacterium]